MYILKERYEPIAEVKPPTEVFGEIRSDTLMSDASMEKIINEVIRAEIVDITESGGMKEFIEQEMNRTRPDGKSAVDPDVMKQLKRINASIDLKTKGIFTSETGYSTVKEVFEFHDSITDVTGELQGVETSLDLYETCAKKVFDFHKGIETDAAKSEALENHKQITKELLKEHSNFSEAEINELVDNHSGPKTIDKANLTTEQKTTIKILKSEI